MPVINQAASPPSKLILAMNPDVTPADPTKYSTEKLSNAFVMKASSPSMVTVENVEKATHTIQSLCNASVLTPAESTSTL